MAQKIYLHIGHYKTGTTALQSMMVANAKSLSYNGLHYLSVMRNHSKHSSLAFSILQAAGVTELMYGYAEKQTPQEIWAQLFDEARRSKAKMVLASTEEFMRIGAHPEAREILRAIIGSVRTEFEFHIIVYLRAPLPHLRSWYNQLVKMNKCVVPSFNAAVCDLMEPIHYDYAQALSPWIDIFGSDAVTIRPYTDDLRQNGALVADFLSVFNLTPRALSKPGTVLSNPRMDDTKIEVTRIMQAALASDIDIERVQLLVDRLRASTKRDQGENMSHIVVRAREGLETLTSLSGNGVDVASFADQLPRPDSDTYAEDITALADLITFLLADIKLLRTNIYKNQEKLLQRVIALEKAGS
jgi:hypothetical protein